MNTQEFILKAKQIHGDKYDYSKVSYQNNHTKNNIICPIHGDFWQTPANHIDKKCGCYICRRTKSLRYLPIKEKRKMREYSIWKSMKNRVSNKNGQNADRYVNRNITCCQEWFNSFEDFYYDMGPCPNGYSLDRINNDLGYYKENCRWADSRTQMQNRGSFNKRFTYNNETYVLKEWSRRLNIKYTTLYHRIYRSHMSFEEAISFGSK